MTRGLTVTITDREGALVRWRGGTTQFNVRRLRMSTGVPGGFLECSFEMAAPAARHWPVEAGYSCVVSLGAAVVWWGWVEDVSRSQRGQRGGVTVRCLGPWQVLAQRLMSATYTDVNSTYVVRDMLATYCGEISQDYSELVNSGSPLTLDWERKSLVDLITLACATGDAENRPLLFAIWEPPGSEVTVSATGTLNDDPELEQLERYWEKNSDLMYYSNLEYVSPRYSWKWRENATGGITHIRRIPVTGSTTYVIDFWLYWTAFSGMTTAARFDWYDAGGDYLSTSYGATLTSDGTSTGWRHVVQTVSSPAGAAKCKPGIGCAVGSGGGSARYLHVDDVRMYQQVTTLAAATRPRAHLWARDMTDWDYGLRTRRLSGDLTTMTTTRDVANWAAAEYGSGSVTAGVTAPESQALYRRRDALLNAGNVGVAEAEAQRDTWLALHGWPGEEVAPLAVRQGDVLDRRGLAVHPAVVRAGARLRVLDGALAGSVFMVEGTEYDGESGELRVQPERYTDVSRMLARVGFARER